MLERSRFHRWVRAGLAGTSLLALLLAGLCLLADRALRFSAKNLELLPAANLLEVEELRLITERKATAGRGFLLTGRREHLEALQRHHADFVATATALQDQNLNASEREALQKAASLEETHHRAIEDTILLRGAGVPNEEVLDQFELRVAPVFVGLSEQLASLDQMLHASLRRAIARASEQEEEVRAMILVVGAIALLLSAALMFVLSRVVTRMHAAASESEQRFRLLVEGIRDYAIVMLDRAGRVLSWNPGAERISGYTYSEIVGHSFRRFFSPEERASGVPQRTVEAARRLGRVEDVGWRLRRDGHRFWARSVLTALQPGDADSGFALITHDETEQKRALATQLFLSEASERLTSSIDLESTANALAQLVTSRLADWCVVFLSEPGEAVRAIGAAHLDPEKERALLEMFRHHPPHAGTSFGIHQSLATGRPELVTNIPPLLLEAIAEDESHRATLRSVGLSGYVTYPLVSRGRAFAALTCGAATPSRRFDEDELALLDALASRAATALDNACLYTQAQDAIEMISVASHDLRGPLHALKLQVSALTRGGGPEALRLEPLVGRMSRQVSRMALLLNTLLDLSRTSLGQQKLQVEELDLFELAKSVGERMSDQLADAECPLSILGGPLRGRWDRFRVEQILTNLLSNAMKYGRGRPVEIAISADNGLARMSVTDHGIGISVEDQQRIFSRFQRAERGRHIEGIGIGLHIVRKLTEALGGEVTVVSRPDEGSTFTVTIPRRLALVTESAPPPSL